MKLPKRKPTRLKNYDYSQNGYYFVTICTHKKEKLLCKIVGEGLCALPKIILSDIGKATDKAINFINQKYETISVDKYVIMPNHLHMIIKIEKLAGGRGDPPLHKIIGELKSFTTHIYGKTLWQRSFHDHIIRNEKDYQKIWNYIETNSQKWEFDCFYTP